MFHLPSVPMICMKRLMIVVALILNITLDNPKSHALTYQSVSIDQAVRKADLIVYVTISSNQTVTRPGKTGQQSKRLFTLHTAQVHQAIKGSASDTLVIVQPGGTRAGLTHVIPGTTRLKDGDRWVLFLRQSPSHRSEWIITGGQHGAKRVRVRASDGAEVINHQVVSPRLKLLNPKVRLIQRAPGSLKRISKGSTQDQSQTPTTHAKPKSKAILLSAHIDRLKTVIDRSQAPLHPTH